MSKKCVRASPVLLLRGPVTSPPPHTLTHTHGRARQTRSRRYYRELHIYCAIPVVSARRIVPPHPKKSPARLNSRHPSRPVAVWPPLRAAVDAIRSVPDSLSLSPLSSISFIPLIQSFKT
jgi:hypothetical protein